MGTQGRFRRPAQPVLAVHLTGPDRVSERDERLRHHGRQLAQDQGRNETTLALPPCPAFSHRGGPARGALVVR